MDTQNVIFYLPSSIFVILAFFFLLLWRLGLSSSWQWAAGFAQTACGFALSSFPIEPTFDQFVSGVFYTGAAYCYGSAILIHFAENKWWPVRRPVAIGFMVPHTYLVLVEPSLRLDLFLIEMVFAFLLGFSVWKVAPKAKPAADLALVAAGALVVVDCLIRGILFTFVFRTSEAMSDFLHSAYNISVHVTTITVCLLFPFGAIAAMTAAAIDRHRHSAGRDPLTGLLNRRGFNAAVEGAGDAIGLSGAVVLCDIDHFKQINDTFGHATGDRVIVEVGNRLSQLQDDRMHIARFGGEEFVVFMDSAREDDAARWAERARRHLAASDWSAAGITGQVTASFGVAEMKRSLIDPAIERADRALYLAKVAGRDRVASASSLRSGQRDFVATTSDSAACSMNAPG
ncbi:diguanylate cyclase (GGDEF)-like protein [Rhizobium azooxidifex]|uniref:diguanylate cyclase n=1 Tax=Mycoplana azooxidifex TaxID=1636188 RepID=A0A7W6D5G8_9HYPH|nr:GGDEF domain-containing protein [Mycoplana azooxidifex]MBB3977106.1 diguanylate cyclase (GGDEF)-like protein [Mycoplana azooxidifex]